GRNKAEAHFQRGEFAEALEGFRALPTAEEPELQSRQAACLFQMGRDQEALALYKKIQKDLPYDAQLGQGLIQLRKENPKAAVAPFRLALAEAATGQRPRVLGFLALALSGSGQDEEAAKLAEEALALDPENAEAHLALSSAA